MNKEEREIIELLSKRKKMFKYEWNGIEGKDWLRVWGLELRMRMMRGGEEGEGMRGRERAWENESLRREWGERRKMRSHFRSGYIFV